MGVQAALALRVMARLIATAGGRRIGPAPEQADDAGETAVIVPVLNEQDRLGACLDGLALQGDEVGEILVVDGGSTDRTPALVERYRQRDARIRLVDASPIPDDWNGKVWGLQVGLGAVAARTRWILTIDADVRPTAPLARALLAQARRERLASLSAATLQRLSGAAEGLIHPAMLATLVYRFGIPGRVFRIVREVQANGQCALFRRDVLERQGGFRAARRARSEDHTIARLLVAGGHRVGFYETDGLVSVKMYGSWREAWDNWPRTLVMRDQFTPISSVLGLIEVTLVQAMPLPLVVLLWPSHTDRAGRWAFLMNAGLAIARVGVLSGTARAYPERPWSYWLSPLFDLPVAIRLWSSLLRRRQVWRGRPLPLGDVS